MSRNRNIQGRQDRLPWIVFALVLLIAATITAAYFVAGGKEQNEGRLAKRPAIRGTACDELREVNDALQSGDREILESSIREARRIAIEALNTSGVAFGEPEKQAIRLGNEKLTSEESLQRVGDRLAAAAESCSQIES